MYPWAISVEQCPMIIRAHLVIHPSARGQVLPGALIRAWARTVSSSVVLGTK